jgi:Spy/CpxP family protein refolding chaperone
MRNQATTDSSSSKQCNPGARRRRRWGRRGLAAFFVVLGLGGVAYAAAPGPGHWKAPTTPEEARAHMGEIAGHVLDRIDADDAQRRAINGVLDRSAPPLWTLRGEGKELREEVRDLLTADKIDREGLEEARKDLLELVDRGSRVAFAGLADSAEALTPAQRRQIAETMARMHK